jgi:hypothetical protein
MSEYIIISPGPDAPVFRLEPTDMSAKCTLSGMLKACVKAEHIRVYRVYEVDWRAIPQGPYDINLTELKP